MVVACRDENLGSVVSFAGLKSATDTDFDLMGAEMTTLVGDLQGHLSIGEAGRQVVAHWLDEALDAEGVVAKR